MFYECVRTFIFSEFFKTYQQPKRIPMKIRYLKPVALLSLPLLLAACGDGYEEVRTNEMFPYGNQRTAGSAVAYVRGQLMPKREMNLSSEATKKEVTEAPKKAPVAQKDSDDILDDLKKDMDEIFEKSQRK